MDLTTSRQIDLLPHRTSDTVAAWLRDHPGAEVVCGDRAGAYVEAVRVRAPDTVQITDRWHLWHSLVGAVEDTVVRHRCDLRPPVEPADPGEDATDTAASEIDCSTSTTGTEMPDGRLAARTRERHAVVQQPVSSSDDDLGDQQETEPRPQDRPPLRLRP